MEKIKKMKVGKRLMVSFLLVVMMTGFAALLSIIMILTTGLTLANIIKSLVVAFFVGTATFSSMKLARTTAKHFSEPIEKMESAIEQLAKGNLNIVIDSNSEASSEDAAEDDSENELDSMAKHFNEAVANIKLYVDTIEFGLSEVGKGNFAVQPPIEFHGDFVALKNAIVKITTELSATMKSINEGADQTAIGADQMADSAQALAEGASSQAGAAQELTATIERVAESSEYSARKAEEANETAMKYADIAEQSGRDMEDLVDAMNKITETSKEIENIIAEIENIASQTNLLSLNASIEAARAGEAGRGFAVVADQIGKLAADSASSAVHTRELISKSLEEINKGDEIVAKTAEALQQVVEGIQTIAEASKESSRLSAEQAETIEQIHKGVEQITEVIQNNSASAEETSATSEELAAQSQTLKMLIEKFELLEV